MAPHQELPSEPTEAEWEEAERRRSRQVVEVHGGYEIKDGLLGPTAEGFRNFKRQYFPIATPAVLSEFSRLTIGDEVGLVGFASRWGVLGYGALPGLRSRDLQWTRDEPVAWIWAHLAGIQLALRLHQLWRREDTNSISQLLAEKGRPPMEWLGGADPHALIGKGKFAEAQAVIVRSVAPPTHDDEPDSGAYVVSAQGLNVSLHRYYWYDGESPRRTTWAILRGIVNPNLRGVHAEISRWAGEIPQGELVTQAFEGLVSVIYRHLFEIIVGGNVEDCRECGTPFKQTDGRQRFCPPPSWARESQCAMRYHKREQRRQEKEKRARVRGEATK
jgi:hypothetical protein